MTPYATLPVTAAGFESPSFGSPSDGAGPAYEWKFLLEETRARKIEGWARERLALDPHGDPALGGAYRTTSLYCDTPQLDVYHRTEAYKLHKFRVRRYGSAPWAFLERKSKADDHVTKRRTLVAEAELPLLAYPKAPRTWSGRWFHDRLRADHLLPACHVVYQRTAFAGSCANGPLRLTLDRDLCGTLTDQWSLTPVAGGLPLLPGRVILELKFRSALPAPFQELVQNLRLTLGIVSKYRLCQEAWGVSAARREVVET